MRPLAVLLLSVVALVLFAPLGRAQEVNPNASDLYGSWRWMETANRFSGSRGTPDACDCERILTLDPGGHYEFVEQDSAHEYLLYGCEFTLHPAEGLTMEDAGPADFWIAFDKWWGYDPAQLIRFVGTGMDTILTYPGGPERWVSDASTTLYVRSRHKPLPRLPLSARPVRSEIDRFPRDGDFVYVEESPILIREIRPAYPKGLKAVPRVDVLLRILVDTLGGVRKVKVLHGADGFTELAVEAVKLWTFMPAKSNNKPVSVWIDLPIRFER